MNLCLPLCIAACLGIASSLPAQSQEERDAADATVAASQPPPADSGRFGNIKQLPSWLRLGFEFRARAEMNLDWEQDQDDRLYLNRFRLSAAVQPVRWLRIFAEGQDARAFSFRGSPVTNQQSTLELHQVYVELGRAEQGWQTRFGRQQLAIADERLIAADSYWDWSGQGFDAIRVSYNRSRWGLDAFAGFRVEAAHHNVNPFDTASRVSGLTGRIQWEGGTLLPYVIWKRGADLRNDLNVPGHKDVVAPGAVVQGAFRGQLEYDVEMALQGGHMIDESLSAWAGHWEMGWRPWGKRGPRLGLEYNYASGDSHPGDGHFHTFDDMYPAGYNKFGMSDPFAWRNISYPFASVEIPLSRRWKALAGYRVYWLAQMADGLYPGGDEFLIRNPSATSSNVGRQVLISVSYAHSERWRLYAGCGAFFAGPYLRQSGYVSNLNTFYIQPSFAF